MVVHCAMLAAAKCLHDNTVLFQGFDHATGVTFDSYLDTTSGPAEAKFAWVQLTSTCAQVRTGFSFPDIELIHHKEIYYIIHL